MRRIKVILGAVAAVAAMMVLAAPAMAQDVDPGFITVEDAGGFDITVFGDAGLFLGEDVFAVGFEGFDGDNGVDLGDVFGVDFEDGFVVSDGVLSFDEDLDNIQFVLTDNPDSFDDVEFA